MLRNRVHWSVVGQSALLVASVFVLLVALFNFEFNLVLSNYLLGGQTFLGGQNPYEITLKNGIGNQFKYSPLFALFMAGLARIHSPSLILELWVFLGALFFSFGLSRWYELSWKRLGFEAIALLACLLDLTLSLAACQANALVAGLILVGLAEYRNNRCFVAGAVLLLASNFKVFPLVFLLSLAFRFNFQYWMGVLVAGLVAFLLPAWFVGWDHNLHMHQEWFRLVGGEAVSGGTLDLKSAFHRVNLSNLGVSLHYGVLLGVVMFFFYPFFVKQTNWRPWMTLGFSSLLLLNPKTEIVSYVLLAPCYVIMISWCAESNQRHLRIGGSVALTILSVAIASCLFIDPNYGVSESPYEIVRVIGALGFWTLTVAVVAKELLRSCRADVSRSAEAK